MNTDQKSKTLFVNGKEVSPFELTGDESKDLAAAKRLLAEQDKADADARRHDEFCADVADGSFSRLCSSTP